MDLQHCNTQTCLETTALIRMSRWESLTRKLGWKPVDLNLATRVVQTSHICNSTTYKFFSNTVWTNDQIFWNLILKDITFGTFKVSFYFRWTLLPTARTCQVFQMSVRTRKLRIVLDLRTQTIFLLLFRGSAKSEYLFCLLVWQQYKTNHPNSGLVFSTK